MNTQYEMLVRDRYQAVPLNINHPIGHHRIIEAIKTCQFTTNDIKKNNKNLKL